MSKTEINFIFSHFNSILIENNYLSKLLLASNDSLSYLIRNLAWLSHIFLFGLRMFTLLIKNCVNKKQLYLLISSK